jgi:hypothetical protein
MGKDLLESHVGVTRYKNWDGIELTGIISPFIPLIAPECNSHKNGAKHGTGCYEVLDVTTDASVKCFPSKWDWLCILRYSLRKKKFYKIAIFIA